MKKLFQLACLLGFVATFGSTSFAGALVPFYDACFCQVNYDKFDFQMNPVKYIYLYQYTVKAIKQGEVITIMDGRIAADSAPEGANKAQFFCEQTILSLKGGFCPSVLEK